MWKEFKKVIGRGNVLDLAVAVVIGAAFTKIVASLAEAKSTGIPVIAYGQFLNDVINFLIIASVVFLLVRQANRFKEKPEVVAPVTRACPYCLSMVPLQATRCAFCTRELKAA
ncbi:MAG: large-conductance mechanosensitive channel protein MscL [Candidatus Latescibacteria bacterium]|nr:large-conductance mechanosensitive channel protein MscL [Candidatus Latescibacterota bacterium]